MTGLGFCTFQSFSWSSFSCLIPRKFRSVLANQRPVYSLPTIPRCPFSPGPACWPVLQQPLLLLPRPVFGSASASVSGWGRRGHGVSRTRAGWTGLKGGRRWDCGGTWAPVSVCSLSIFSVYFQYFSIASLQSPSLDSSRRSTLFAFIFWSKLTCCFLEVLVSLLHSVLSVKKSQVQIRAK